MPTTTKMWLHENIHKTWWKKTPEKPNKRQPHLLPQKCQTELWCQILREEWVEAKRYDPQGGSNKNYQDSGELRKEEEKYKTKKIQWITKAKIKATNHRLLHITRLFAFLDLRPLSLPLSADNFNVISILVEKRKVKHTKSFNRSSTIRVSIREVSTATSLYILGGFILVLFHDLKW